MISYRGKERHPRVMIAKKKTEKRTKKEQKQARTKKAQRRRAGRTLGSLPLNHLRFRKLIKTSPKRLSRGKKRKSKRRK